MTKKKVDNKVSDKQDLDKESASVEKQEKIEEQLELKKVPLESNNPESFSDKQIIEMQKTIQNLQIKLKDSEDKLLRLHADFENFRKRGIKEKSDIRKNTQFETISAILPVLDHFELALNASAEARNVDAVLDGMKLIKSEFDKTLDSLGVDTIHAIGEPFNPEIHEAVANESSDEYDKNVVARQWRAGYKLGDRLIRPATVVVSNGSNAKDK